MPHVHGNTNQKRASKGGYATDYPKLYHKIYHYTVSHNVDLNASDACRVLLENHSPNVIAMLPTQILVITALWHLRDE